MIIKMPQSALYLGGRFPPNMEAYLDSLLYRTRNEKVNFELIIVGNMDPPAWLIETDRVSIARYDGAQATGIARARVTAFTVRQYLRTHDPDEIRQITQPRWHAPGVLTGAIGTDTRVCTRASASLFKEYQEAPSPIRAWLANNAFGRSIFLADAVYTPKYGGVDLPWWAPADLIVEERTVNRERFSPDTTPREDLFSRSDNRVLTVGRISRRKGTDLLLEVAERVENAEFVVVGPVGDDDLAAALDNTTNVHRYQPVDYIEMPGLYAACDLVLSVSRLEWGGVSRAMLEGSASGRPIVALDRGSARDVVDVAVPTDPDAIANVVRRILD
jgi:glycosyltransferase involved in cell wall biosynthesis